MAVVAPLTVTGTGSGGAGIVTADLATVPCASCAKAAPVQAASKKTLIDRRQRTCDISHSPGDQRTSEKLPPCAPGVIGPRLKHVRFWQKADISMRSADVCFWG